MPDRSEDGRWAFSWAVSPGGYELVRVGGDPARVSIAPIRTPAAEAGADHWPRLTYPLRDAPTLFRQFAVLDTSDPQSLRAFVNAHGLLTVSPYRDANRSIPNDEPFDRYLVHPPGGGRLGEAVDDRPSSGDRVWAESVVSWICEVARMRELVTLWDRVRGRDVDTLQRHMKYTSLHSGILDRMGGRSEGGEVECFNSVEYCPVGSPTRIANFFARWVYDTHPHLSGADRTLTGCYRWAITAAPCEGVVAAAERVVVGQVNLAIRSARPVLTPRDRVGGWELRLEPQTLRDALWVQFQSAIAGGKDYRTCPGCGNWFEVSATEDGRTTRRQYCHSRCKVRHFRSRQARALALKAEGYSAKQIAEQLGATVTTVRVWLGEKAN